jgi:alpha-L-arabinofuranosidase
MIEMQDRHVRCYLDGAMVSDVTLPRPETILAISGRDAKSGDVIVKILNTTSETVGVKVKLDGAAIRAGSKLTVLTSQDREDENSFEQPTKIAPTSRTMKAENPSTVSLSPYSLNILRLQTKDKTE